MSKPKWKSTVECVNEIAFGLGYKIGITPYRLKLEKVENRDQWMGRWMWKICGPDFTITGESYTYYEDQAANDAYQFAWKYLRKKRLVKRAKGGATL